jgi:heat shock protein HtpX
MERMKVFMLMAGLTALLVVLGGAVGGQQGMILFFAFAALMNFGMYWVRPQREARGRLLHCRYPATRQP